MSRLSWIRMWPLAAIMAVVASMAPTLQASAEGPAPESGTSLTVSIVISPEAIDQLAGLLKHRYLPRQAREAISTVLEQAGYDPAELAALLDGSKHRDHDDGDDDHGNKGDFCERVLADPDEHEEYVARCEFLKELANLTPQEICDRALANAEADAAIIETLVKRCAKAIKGDEALRASVCASVEAAGEPVKLLQTCLLAELGELTPQGLCARAFEAAPADEPILGILTSRCKSAIKHGDVELQTELCASVEAAASAPEVLVKRCEWVAERAEREAQKALMRKAMSVFFECKQTALEGETRDETLARCAAEVEAEFGIVIDTSKFSGDKHRDHDDDDDDHGEHHRRRGHDDHDDD